VSARLPACGITLAASLALAVFASAPPLSASVRVHVERISRGSPFSPSAPCVQANPGFSPGFAQETSVAANPRNPRQILVSWIQDGRTTDTVMASRDGGRSFSRVFVPGLSACTGGPFQVASDPGVAFNANGRKAYFTAIVVDNPESAEGASTAMIASRSSDGGFSWGRPYVIQPLTGEFWDLPRLTADPRRPKQAYYVYDLREPPGFFSGYSVLSTTTDGGRTWSAPQGLYDPGTSNSWPAITKILVNRDGSLVAISAIVATDPADPLAPNPTQQVAVRSVDGGRTWGAPITIGDSAGRRPNDPATGNVFNAYVTYPSQTVAPNGDLYVSWVDTGDGNESSRIAIARSTDGGRHWRTRELATHAQAALPTVEVAGDGTVGVLYYKIAQSSSNGYWSTRIALATSPDRGRHWSQRAVTRPFNLLTAGTAARPCCFLGDYEGSGSLPHGFVAAFPMGQPIAKHGVDAYFIRVMTSGRGAGRR